MQQQHFDPQLTQTGKQGLMSIDKQPMIRLINFTVGSLIFVSFYGSCYIGLVAYRLMNDLKILSNPLKESKERQYLSKDLSMKKT